MRIYVMMKAASKLIEMQRSLLHMILLVVVLALSVLPVRAQCNETLGAVAGSVSNAQTTSLTFVDTGASATVDLGAATDEVLVIASYTSGNVGSSYLTGSWRVSDGTNNSAPIERFIQNAQDKGIGSAVHIFSGVTGSTTFYLQHKTDRQTVTTTGTIVAISLRTSPSGIGLNNDMAERTTVFSHASSSYTTVPDTTIEVSLPTSGDIYVAVSFGSASGGGSGRQGKWKLQYRQQGAGTWNDLGYESLRDLSGTNDTGAISLTAIKDSLAAGTYEFSLAVSAVDNLNVNTFNVTLVGVALAYSSGSSGYFPTFQAHASSVSTTSGSLVEAVSVNINVSANTDAFLGAQYELTGDGQLQYAAFDVAVDDGSTYNSLDQQRLLQNAGDFGNGASVGLATGLAASNTYKMQLRYAADGDGTTATLNNPYLVGFGLKCESFTFVELAFFTTTSHDGYVLLEWETASELDTAGFHLWRSEAEAGLYTRLNAEIIPARGGPTTGASYSYLDDAVTNGVTYWYKLEDVDTHGVSTMHGPVSATPQRLRRLHLPLLVKGVTP